MKIMIHVSGHATEAISAQVKPVRDFVAVTIKAEGVDVDYLIMPEMLETFCSMIGDVKTQLDELVWQKEIDKFSAAKEAKA